jgi:filamentous hemagglutinin family protein
MKVVVSLCGCGVTIGSAFLISAAQAQVVPDGSLNTTVNAVGNNFTIDNGTTSGTNLFHSFREFSIPSGGAAIFNNAPTIQNIFSRVTGGTVSNIDGVIRANGTANLFLLNPSGILFGANASLNIGGSFVGTTANSIKFADGVEFSGTNPAPLLTMSVPIGLQMGTNPGEIQLQGATLETPTDQALILLGGHIKQSGSTIDSNGGQLEIGSVQQPSLIKLTADWQLNYDQVQAFGDIQIADQSRIFSSGTGGGGLQLQGRNISVTGLSYIWSITEGDRDGNPLLIRASESLEVNDVTMDGGDFSWIMTTVALGAKGRGSDLQIVTPRLMSDGGYIAALTYGEGNAGNLTIQTGTLKLSNSAQISTSTLASGSAGDLWVQATNEIEIVGFKPSVFFGEFFIFSSSIFADADFGSTGNGGNVLIETNRLRVADGGRIAAAVESTSSGNAGSLTIRAKDMQVDGVVINEAGALSGVQVDVQPGAQGKGGTLRLEVDRLQVLNGGQISASNFGTGQAGNISIQAGWLDIAGTNPDGQIASRISATSQTEFPAGSVLITARDIQVRDRGMISVSSLGNGNAGNLSIQTDRLRLDQGSLQAQAGGGNEGNIRLDIASTLLLRNGSNITTNAAALAAGGDIAIQAPLIVGLENSDLIANAVGGRGGNIDITTQGIIGLEFRNTLTPRTDPTNDITASSQFSINGTVQINNIGVDPNSGLVTLPVDIVDPSQQIATGCADQKNGSFIVTGRGGVSLNPSQALSADRPWQDLRTETATSRVPFLGKDSSNATIEVHPLLQATHWQRNAHGSIELLATNPSSMAQSAQGTCADVRKP